MSLPRVYFFCSPEADNLQDDIIILAEGLQSLGIPYFASANYWRRSTAPDDFLFRHTPEVQPDDCDVVVLPYTWYNWIKIGIPYAMRQPTPAGLFKTGRRYRTVYMDTSDGWQTVSWEPEFRQFDVIFRTKLNRRIWHPSNFRPWVLGLSNRMLRHTRDAPPFSERRRSVLINFGASHHYPHTSRLRAQAKLDPLLARHFPLDATRDDLSIPPSDPLDRLMWEQTNRRHSPSYYDRLKQNQIVSCFCGELIPPMPWRNPQQYLVGGNKAKVKMAFFRLLAHLDPRPERIVQWDSWRFWESLAAGCVAINLDLERYGAELPVVPEIGRHYIGVDLDNPRPAVERLVEDKAGLEQISREGHDWALRHYTPPAMASRFLKELGFTIHADAPAT